MILLSPQAARLRVTAYVAASVVDYLTTCVRVFPNVSFFFHQKTSVLDGVAS